MTKIQAVCEDGETRTARFTGSADSLFSRPARVKVGSRTVTGFVTQEGDRVVFIATGKHKHALSVWDGGKQFAFKLDNSKDRVRPSSLVQCRDNGEVYIARVLQFAKKDGVGADLNEPAFVTLALNKRATGAMTRLVVISNVIDIIDVGDSQFHQDFFSPDFDPERARWMAREGAYNEQHYSTGARRYDAHRQDKELARLRRWMFSELATHIDGYRQQGGKDSIQEALVRAYCRQHGCLDRVNNPEDLLWTAAVEAFETHEEMANSSYPTT